MEPERPGRRERRGVGGGGVPRERHGPDGGALAERGDARVHARRRARGERRRGSPRVHLRGALGVGRRARVVDLREQRLDRGDQRVVAGLAIDRGKERGVAHAVVDDGVRGVHRGVEEGVHERAVAIVDDAREPAVRGDRVRAREVRPRLRDARVDAVLQRREERDLAREDAGGGALAKGRDVAREDGVVVAPGRASGVEGGDDRHVPRPAVPREVVLRQGSRRHARGERDGMRRLDHADGEDVAHRVEPARVRAARRERDEREEGREGEPRGAAGASHRSVERRGAPPRARGALPADRPPADRGTRGGTTLEALPRVRSDSVGDPERPKSARPREPTNRERREVAVF